MLAAVLSVPPGLANVPRRPKVGGSISSEDKNDVLSSSGFVLVMVRKESRRLFCSLFGVPFRSRI